MEPTPDRTTDGRIPAATPVTPASGAPLDAPVHAAPAASADVRGAAHDAARVAAADAAGTTPAADAERGVGLGGAQTKGGNTAVGVGAGVVAGTMAGLQAGALGGAALLGVGGLAGALLGGAAGAALAQDADPTRYTPEVDAHYRALYDAAAGAVAAEPLAYLEDVAVDVAARVLSAGTAARVRVAVRKPHVAMPGPLAYAEVVLERDAAPTP